MHYLGIAAEDGAHQVGNGNDAYHDEEYQKMYVREYQYKLRYGVVGTTDGRRDEP